MQTASDVLFKSLADPTRRALFERLSRDGAQTVRVLTDSSGVSQPAVSKHLGVLKRAGLVRARQRGRQTHYSAQPQALAPLADWMSDYSRFWHDRFDRLEDLLAQKDQPMTATRSLVIERELPHPLEKVWRALTHGPLMKEWLLDNDFQPVVGHRFNFRSTPMPGWDGIVDCEVLAVEPDTNLSYSWNALGVESVVVWTLAATSGGTLLRMEQSGFRPDQEANYQGAGYAWQKFIGELERVVAGLQ